MTSPAVIVCVKALQLCVQIHVRLILVGGPFEFSSASVASDKTKTGFTQKYFSFPWTSWIYHKYYISGSIYEKQNTVEWYFISYRILLCLFIGYAKMFNTNLQQKQFKSKWLYMALYLLYIYILKNTVEQTD